MEVKWTPARLEALKLLADLSTVYRPNGQAMSKRNWVAGIQKLKSQNYQAWKLIKDMPLRAIKWTWSKYQNVCYGFCATTMCGNRIEPGEFYCKVCKPVGSKYHRGVYSNPYIKEHIGIVRRAICDLSDREIKDLVIANIGRIPYDIRKDLLGDNFKSLIREEEQKKLVKVKTKKAK